MSYQVIARRWRPQNFDEVVSQDHVSKTLKNSIKSGRISHSYIFTGPRGVGKTTTARILAKSLNCVHGPTETPCGVCENCLEITAGNSFDVIEIDGASNNSVDNIRDLREKVAFAPVKSNYKIYIIDEVHMLSIGAFNALLKTLEEPPPHVIFIFATTEIHKVPETILSRCQKYFFKKFDTESTVRHLKKIVDTDGYDISEKILYAIARTSAGAMRDAQSLLEQVLSFSDGSDDAILAVLGVLPVESYLKILKNIAEGNKKGIVSETSEVVKTGIDALKYIDGFNELLRAIRLVLNSIELEGFSGYSAEEIIQIKKISSLYCDEEISIFFKILKDLTTDLKYAENEKIFLEMAFLDMAAVKERPSISALIKKIDNNSFQDSGQIEEKKNGTFHNRTQMKSETDNDVLIKHKSAASDNSGSDIWSLFLKSIKFTKQYLYNKLSICTTSIKDDIIIITFPENGGSRMGKVKFSLDSKDTVFIEEQLKILTSRNIKIIFDNKAEEVPLPENQMIEDVEHSEINQENPVVSKLVNTFYGQIIEKKGDK
ncbi:MAG: DNA polymerase III subunit gamma/tau [Spirochaetes bacterium]|nr:DNA polymerase III subunit gamma/tau [Spirochaetota bacterium]